MTELQKKLARRRNLNGEIESSSSPSSVTSINERMELTSTIQHANTSNNVNNNVASDETNIGSIYNATLNATKETACVSPNRKQNVLSVKDNSNSSTSSSMSELQAKLSRRRTLNREHDSMSGLASDDAIEYTHHREDCNPSISVEDITLVTITDDIVNNISVDVIPVEKVDDLNSEEQAEFVVDIDHSADIVCQYSPIESEENNGTKVQEIKLEVLMDGHVSISTIRDGIALSGGSTQQVVICDAMVVDGDVHSCHMIDDDIEDDDNDEEEEEKEEEKRNKSDVINSEGKINVTRDSVQNDNTSKRDEIISSYVDILDNKLDRASDDTPCIDSSAIIPLMDNYTDDDTTSEPTGYVEESCVEDNTTVTTIVVANTEMDSDSISGKSKVKGIISKDEYNCTSSKMQSNHHNQFNKKDKNNHKKYNDTNVLFKDDDDNDNDDNQINHSSQIASDLDGVYQLLIDNESLKQEIMKLKEYAVENERIKKESSKITDQLLVEQSKFKELMAVNDSLRNEVSQLLMDSKNSKNEILKLRYLSFENDDLKVRVKELSMENEQLKNELSKTSELSIDNEFLKNEIKILKQELSKHLQNEERIRKLERESRDVSSISASSPSKAQQQHLEQVPVDARPDRHTSRRFVHSLRYVYHSNDQVGSSNNGDIGDDNDGDDDESSMNMFDNGRNSVDTEQQSRNGSPIRVNNNNNNINGLYNDEYETILNTHGDAPTTTTIDNSYGDNDGDVEYSGSSSNSSNELNLDLLLQSVSGITDFDKYNFDEAKNSKINSKWSHKARTLINEKELVKSFLSISLIEHHNDNSNSQNDDLYRSESNYNDTESSSSSSSSSKNNMEYTEFLKKFASCDDLVNFTRDFISSVLGPEGDTSKPKHPKKLGYIFYGLHKLDIRCKSFFDQMQDIFIKYNAFQDENEERIICARDCLEQYVLGRIGEYAFQTVLHDDEDRKLLQRMETMSFITYESLDIKASLYNEDMIHHAIEELKKINIFKTPGDKVACIVKSATVVFKLLSIHAQQQKRRKQQLKQQQRLDKVESNGNSNSNNSSNNNNSSNDDNSNKESYDDRPRDQKDNDDDNDEDTTSNNEDCEEKDDDDIDTGAGADDFLPLFIWVVLKSHVPRLVSNCEYIQTYLNSARLMSQSGYCLINLRSAIEFITNITAELINMDPLIFDMKCKQMEREL